MLVKCHNDVLSGISDLMQIRSIPVRMELDDTEVLEGEYIFGAVCNSTSIGGVMKLNPSVVDLSDGLFEILLIRAPKSLQEIPECLLAVQKQQYNSAMMTFRTASHIQVEADPQMLWSLDGEKAEGGNRIEIRCLPGAVRLKTDRQE